MEGCEVSLPRWSLEFFQSSLLQMSSETQPRATHLPSPSMPGMVSATSRRKQYPENSISFCRILSLFPDDSFADAPQMEMSLISMRDKENQRRATHQPHLNGRCGCLQLSFPHGQLTNAQAKELLDVAIISSSVSAKQSIFNVTRERERGVTNKRGLPCADYPLPQHFHCRKYSNFYPYLRFAPLHSTSSKSSSQTQT